MEKNFLPLIIVICLMSTMAVTAIGKIYADKNPDRDSCVKSRICAINYMNNLEKEQE